VVPKCDTRGAQMRHSWCPNATLVVPKCDTRGAQMRHSVPKCDTRCPNATLGAQMRHSVPKCDTRFKVRSFPLTYLELVDIVGSFLQHKSCVRHLLSHGWSSCACSTLVLISFCHCTHLHCSACLSSSSLSLLCLALTGCLTLARIL